MSALNYTYDWNKARNRKILCATTENKFSSLNLKVSDPGKLLSLVATLWDETCPPLERKVNNYLTDVTGSELTFFMHDPSSDPDMLIHVIGDVVLPETLRVPIGCDFSQRVLKASSPICTDGERFIDADLLNVLKKQLQKTANEKFSNIVIVPFSTKDNVRVSCYYALVNSSLKIGALHRNQTLVIECLSYCKAIILNTYVCDTERKHSVMCSNAITNSALAFSHVDDETALATVIQKQTAKMLNAEKCKVYFFKEIKKKELATVLEIAKSSNELEEPRISQTNLTTYVSTPEIIINKPPSEAFHFSEILHKDFRNITTLMSFPTFYDGEANGHVEVMNKKTLGGFNKDDEEYARCLGATNGLAVEAMWKWRELRSDQSKSEIIDCVLMRRAPVICRGLKFVMYCQDSHSYDYLLEFRFRPLDVPEEHILCIMMGIFDELEFMRTMRLDEFVLLRFLISVKNAHGSLPYHNFYCSFGNAHFAFVLLHRLSLMKQGILTNLEGFALLLAVFTHNVDFRGCTTRFQLYAGENMAALYSSAGGVQQKLALTAVLQLITHPCCNVLSKLDLDEFRTFVALLHILILDANFAFHVSKMSEIYLSTFRTFDRSNTKDVRLLLSLLLTSAELSDYTKPWNCLVETHERQMEEYFRESQDSLGGVFDLEEAVLTPKAQMELQAKFIKCSVLPLFENLYVKYPTTFECHRRAEVNLEILEELIGTLEKHPEHTLANLHRPH